MTAAGQRAGRAAAGRPRPGGQLPHPAGAAVQAADPGGGRGQLLGRHRRDPGPGRGVGLRQDLDRPGDRPAGGAGGRPGAVPRGGRHARPRRRALRQLRREIQVVFQDPFESLDPRLTAFDTVEESLLVHRLGGTARRAARAGAAALEQVGLHPGRADRPPLPAPALRRPAAAAGDRRGHGPRPGPADRRRASLDARRLAAGRDPAAHARPARAARGIDPVRYP